MRRMHKPGQAKRMLALLDRTEYGEWLERPPAAAYERLRPRPAELLLDEASQQPPTQRSRALGEMAGSSPTDADG